MGNYGANGSGGAESPEHPANIAQNTFDEVSVASPMASPIGIRRESRNAGIAPITSGTDTHNSSHRQLPASKSARYLAKVLSAESSLRAAFEPVVNAARCQYTSGVDRTAFAQAIAQIVGHFSTSGSSGPIVSSASAYSLEPLTEEEAFEQFREVLQVLLDRLSALATAEHTDLPTPSTGPSTMLATVPGKMPSPVLVPPPCSSTPPHTVPPARNKSPVQQQQQQQQTYAAYTAPRQRSKSPGLLAAEGCREGQSLNCEGIRPDTDAELQASRNRVAELRRILAKEEELIRRQAEEIHELEQFKNDIERHLPEPESPTLLGAPATMQACNSSAVNGKGSDWNSEGTVFPALQAAAQAPLSSSKGTPNRPVKDYTASPRGPLSLDDLKSYLDHGKQLRNRVRDIEADLDKCEEGIAAMSGKLELRLQSLSRAQFLGTAGGYP